MLDPLIINKNSDDEKKRLSLPIVHFKEMDVNG
jgi:hypothetical protein